MKNTICFFLLFLLACSSKEDSQLEYALNFAGKNRFELDKVLKHYENDSLKLKAASFLIRNMPQHFSLEVPNMDLLEQLKVKSIREDSLSITDLTQLKQLQKSMSYRRIFDCQVITANYLIENIDWSFKIWKERPWAKHYSFDDFCQMILPYRIGHEPLESWKKDYYKVFSPLLDSLYQGSDVIAACNALSVYLGREGISNNYVMPSELPYYRPSFLLRERSGACNASTNFAIYTLRSLGIPVNQDILYYSYDLSQAHYWVSVKDTTGELVTTDFDIKGIERGKNDDDIRPKRKIYRQVYGEQPRYQTQDFKFEGLRRIRGDCFVQDITAEYHGKNVLSFMVPVPEGEPFVYLCAFGRKGWIPQAVAAVKGNNATFENIGAGLLYFLACYNTSDELKAIGNPFFFDGKKVHYFDPDFQHSDTARLIRKTPLASRVIDHLDNILDISIEYAENPSFEPSHLLHKITDTIRGNYNVVPIVPSRKFRYVRCSASADKKMEFAELAFYSDDKMEQELPYAILDKNLPSSIWNIRDKDPLSYYTAEDKGTSFHLDFSKAVTVQKLMFIPRNDDNFIRIGDEYELCFYNGDAGWTSLGKQLAKENYLLYAVPRNAVFWLKDLTRGQEEKLFIYQEDGQTFYL